MRKNFIPDMETDESDALDRQIGETLGDEERRKRRLDGGEYEEKEPDDDDDEF